MSPNNFSSPKQKRIIETYLKEEKVHYGKFLKEPKLLILGTSDSGKSTFIKQLKIIHGSGYSSEQLSACRDTIHDNISNAASLALAQSKNEDLKEVRFVFVLRFYRNIVSLMS